MRMTVAAWATRRTVSWIRAVFRKADGHGTVLGQLQRRVPEARHLNGHE